MVRVLKSVRQSRFAEFGSLGCRIQDREVGEFWIWRTWSEHFRHNASVPDISSAKHQDPKALDYKPG